MSSEYGNVSGVCGVRAKHMTVSSALDVNREACCAQERGLDSVTSETATDALFINRDHLKSPVNKLVRCNLEPESTNWESWQSRVLFTP